MHQERRQIPDRCEKFVNYQCHAIGIPENGLAYLRDLVWMPLTNRFGGEEEGSLSVPDAAHCVL